MVQKSDWIEGSKEDEVGEEMPIKRIENARPVSEQLSLDTNSHKERSWLVGAHASCTSFSFSSRLLLPRLGRQVSFMAPPFERIRSSAKPRGCNSSMILQRVCSGGY